MVSMDGFSGFLKENGKKAMEAAKEAATIAKIKADIKTEELKMNNTYAEIGKLFCAHAAGEIDEIFIPLLQKAADSKERIINLEAELDKLKRTVTCAECGAKSPLGSRFCNSCGAEVSSVVDVDDADFEETEKTSDSKDDADIYEEEDFVKEDAEDIYEEKDFVKEDAEDIYEEEDFDGNF